MQMRVHSQNQETGQVSSIFIRARFHLIVRAELLRKRGFTHIRKRPDVTLVWDMLDFIRKRVRLRAACRNGIVVRYLSTLLVGGLVAGCATLPSSAVPTLIANNACVPTNGTPTLFALSFNLTNSLIQVTPSIRCGLFRVSDTVTISTVNNVPIRIVSLCGDQLYYGPPGDFQFDMGHYFVETDGDRTQFAVLPNDYQGAPFLGTEAKTGGSQPWDVAYSQRLDQIQPGWARMLNGYAWTGTEPQRGVWNWEGSDATVAANQGRKIIYGCGYIRPAWVGDSEFVARFAEYTGAVAARYDGQIYAIEVWNEPNFEAHFPYPGATTNWNAVTQFYAQLLNAGQQAIRSVSSSIHVTGPAWAGTGYIAETALLVQLGAGQWLDELSFHDGTMKSFAPDSMARMSSDSAPHIVSGVDTQCAEYEAALPGKPILADEIDFYGHSALGIDWTRGVDPAYLSDLDWELGMRRAIKYGVMYRAAGAEVMIPFILARNAAYPDGNVEMYGWDLGPKVGTSRGPHPKTSSLLMTCYWLNGATFLGRQTSTSNESVYAWGYPDGSSLVFAWCREGYSTSFLPDPAWQVTDIFGQPVSATVIADNPILIHVPASVPSDGVVDTVTSTIQPPQPDYPNLVVPLLVYPFSASTGETIQVIESVQNIGHDAGPFSVGIYLWSPPTGSILIGTRALDGLAAGAVSLATNSITLPQNLISGSYSGVSVADYLDQLQKVNGDWNRIGGGTPIVITGFPSNTTLTLVPMSNQTIVAGQTLTLTVAAATSSTNALGYSAAPPHAGAAMDPTNGVFTWTPSLSQIGAHAVNFAVTDSKHKASKSVVITVKKPNTPPILKPIWPRRVRAGRGVRFRLKAKDRNHDPLVFTIEPLPPGATFDSLRHKFTWMTATDTALGTYSLTASVTDGEFTNSQPVSVTVH